MRVGIRILVCTICRTFSNFTGFPLFSTIACSALTHVWLSSPQIAHPMPTTESQITTPLYPPWGRISGLTPCKALLAHRRCPLTVCLPLPYSNVFPAAGTGRCVGFRSSPDLRQNVVAAISELMTELKDMRGIIRDHAKDTIHAKWVCWSFCGHLSWSRINLLTWYVEE